jgi:D-sedoheptulose 7-phosphate isomerase
MKKYPNKKQIEKVSDLILGVPADETARIQELHILVGHLMCAVIDEVF